uniref:Uncharacterized protein n=1 Tax=Romanomermis culicivorax TaxID=13658 RepID=A0A915KHT1_ROMCU
MKAFEPEDFRHQLTILDDEKRYARNRSGRSKTYGETPLEPKMGLIGDDEKPHSGECRIEIQFVSSGLNQPDPGQV